MHIVSDLIEGTVTAMCHVRYMCLVKPLIFFRRVFQMSGGKSKAKQRQKASDENKCNKMQCFYYDDLRSTHTHTHTQRHTASVHVCCCHAFRHATPRLPCSIPHSEHFASCNIFIASNKFWTANQNVSKVSWLELLVSLLLFLLLSLLLLMLFVN